MRRYLPKNTEELIGWYEQYAAPFALAFGFATDYIAFRNLDLASVSLALLVYLGLAVFGMTLLNFFQTGNITHRILKSVAPFLPVVVQFSFGGLFGSFVIVYAGSAALAASWVFVIILAALLIGNERFRAKYVQFPFQISILFTSLFAYLVFVLPLVFGRIGADIFLISGVVSVLVVSTFLYVLRNVFHELVEREYVQALKRVGAIFLIFVVLYFTHAIPPLPLALREAEVLHYIERDGATYRALSESTPLYRKYWPFKNVYHRAPNEFVYVYSAVFAPIRFSTTVTHEWEHFNETTGEWDREGSFTFPIFGGRNEGYRGYSIKTNITEGKWRVYVLGPGGARVGKVSFYIENVKVSPPLIEKVF